MSVEETQQPSFTVTADIQPPATGVSQSSRASESLESYANPTIEPADTSANTHEGPETESESLQQWTISQQNANGSVRLEQETVAGPDGKGEVGEGQVDGELDGSQVEIPGHLNTSRESQSPGPDISTTPIESATKGSEGENIPSPTNTPPPATNEIVLPSNAPEAQLRPNGNINLQPINRYSPHKTPNFIIPPSASTKRSLFGRQRKSVIEEKDSFAEDDAKLQKQVRPVEKLKRMMERYDSTTSNKDTGGDGFSVDEVGMGVPGWDEVGMQPEESVAAAVLEEVGATEGLKAGEGAGSSQNKRSPPDESHRSSGADEAPRQDSQTSPPPPERSPSPANSTKSRSLSQSPAPRRNGFNTLIESESSLGMPSEMNFTQDDDIESQHSTHSIPNIATQSLHQNRPPYLSSPPPSPRRENGSDPRSHPSTISTDQNGQSAKGTTQEATQLVTEDELINPSVPASPPTFPARRVLPTARARLAGRDVISQPADRSRPHSAGAQGPHTIAAPGRLLARKTPVEPLVMEETYVDGHRLPAGEEDEDVDMSAPEQARDPEPHSPATQAQSSPLNQPATSPALAPPEPTYVDPTLTSLPPPPPKRPTPVKYGHKAALALPAKPVSPVPTPAPSGLATPPPTAGPSDSPQAQPSLPSPGDQPAPTKSGRIPKRKRRDSSASMSSSSSSSEDVDMYDESYRPAVTVKSVKPTHKGKGKATNPNLKRVKQEKGARSRSSSHTTSASTTKEATTTERSTPLTEGSEHSEPDLPDRPWVLACWYPNWFIGRVRGISRGKYDVDYEDGTHSLVAVDRVRRGVLEIGDKVKSEDHKGMELTVVEEWNGDERGVKVKGQTERLKLSRVYIRQAVIKADFQNRIIAPQDLGFDYTPPTAPRPLMNASTKSISTTSDIFAGKIFFITSTSSASAANKNNQKDATTQITRNGGKFVEKWYELFDLPQSGFGSTLASTSAPFLIQETSQASLTPKALVSLAKGIPCLSMAYVQDVIADPSVRQCNPVDPS
jgi:hypothetical protein